MSDLRLHILSNLKIYTWRTTESLKRRKLRGLITFIRVWEALLSISRVPGIAAPVPGRKWTASGKLKKKNPRFQIFAETQLASKNVAPLVWLGLVCIIIFASSSPHHGLPKAARRGNCLQHILSPYQGAVMNFYSGNCTMPKIPYYPQTFLSSQKLFSVFKQRDPLSTKKSRLVCKGRTGMQPMFYVLPMWKMVAQLQSCMKRDESMVNCSLGTGGKNIVQWRQAGDSIIYLAISESRTSSLTRGCDYYHHTPKHSSSQHTYVLRQCSYFTDKDQRHQMVQFVLAVVQ